MHTLSEKIAAIVQSRYGGNWSEAGRAAGLTPTTMQKLKTGCDPRVSTVRRVAVGWAVSADWLLDLPARSVADGDTVVYAALPAARAGSADRRATIAVVDALHGGGLSLPGAQVAQLIDFATRHGLDADDLRQLVDIFCLERAQPKKQ